MRPSEGPERAEKQADECFAFPRGLNSADG